MGLHVNSNTPKKFGRREYQTMFCVCDRFSYGVIAYYSTTRTDFIISSISGSLCHLSLIMDVITRICHTHEDTPINMSVISIVTLCIRYVVCILHAGLLLLCQAYIYLPLKCLQGFFSLGPHHFSFSHLDSILCFCLKWYSKIRFVLALQVGGS